MIAAYGIAILISFLASQPEKAAETQIGDFWLKKLKANQMYGLPDSRWHPFFVNEEMFASLDRTTVQRGKSGRLSYRVWMRKDLAEPLHFASGGDATHFVTHDEIDCGGRRTKTFTSTAYGATGSPLLTDPYDNTEYPDPPWQIWRPMSAGERMYANACEDLPGLLALVTKTRKAK